MRSLLLQVTTELQQIPSILVQTRNSNVFQLHSSFHVSVFVPIMCASKFSNEDCIFRWCYAKESIIYFIHKNLVVALGAYILQAHWPTFSFTVPESRLFDEGTSTISKWYHFASFTNSNSVFVRVGTEDIPIVK